MTEPTTVEPTTVEPTAAGTADDGTEPLRFRCPRCGGDARARWYGPCEECRAVLRATLGGEGSDVVAAAYEPKMNVTPNAVALKE